MSVFDESDTIEFVDGLANRIRRLESPGPLANVSIEYDSDGACYSIHLGKEWYTLYYDSTIFAERIDWMVKNEFLSILQAVLIKAHGAAMSDYLRLRLCRL
jgi:hypothetical protein